MGAAVFDELRERVFEANREIVRAGLVVLTFGNASAADRAAGVMAIKPSGVRYDELRPESMVVVDLESGAVVDSEYQPSSDTPTHVVLYRAFAQVGGVVHTHSPFATAWAQACREIPCLGTTHADHFHGPVPVTRQLTRDEIERRLRAPHRRRDRRDVRGACISTRSRCRPCSSPRTDRSYGGPMSRRRSRTRSRSRPWPRVRSGPSCSEPASEPIGDDLLRRHFLRKHGPGAYYGQGRVKALRLHGAGDLRLHEEPPPTPGDGELLLRVTAVGLCGSDRHWFSRGWDRRRCSDASRSSWATNSSARSSPVRAPGIGWPSIRPIPCRRCAVCLAGQPHLCPELRFAGHDSTDGALRSLLTWPERLTYRLPDTLSDVEGALLEPLGVALHALDLGHVQPGTSAGVFGCGPIGLLLVQALRAAGVTAILATDRSTAPGRGGGGDGRDACAPRGGGACRASVERLPGGLGVDVAFEVAGEDDAVVADAIDAIRPGGRVVLVGIPDGDRTSFSASTARRKGLTMLLCRRMAPGDLPRAIRLVESGRVELVPLVTERCALSEWREAFGALVERRGLKVVIEPQPSERGRDSDEQSKSTRSASTLARSRGAPSSSTAPTDASSRRPSTSTGTASSTSGSRRLTTTSVSSPTGRSRIRRTTSGRSRRRSPRCSPRRASTPPT